MKKLVALLLILSTPAYADNAITVHTGDVVSKEFNEGTLLDKGQANKLKDQLIERDGFEKQNESYKKSVELYKTNEAILYNQKDTLLNQNMELSKTLNDTRTTSNWERFGYVLLGVAITAVAVKGASSLK